MKKFTDFHLYLGAPVKVYFEDASGKKTIERNGRLSWNHEEDSEWVIYTPEDGEDFDDVDFDFKLVLRQLNDMTEKEEAEMLATQEEVKLDGYPEIVLKVDSGETFRYMLSKGFDLFNLIPEGLAIDSKTLKPE